MSRYEEIKGDGRTCADLHGTYWDMSGRVTEVRGAARSVRSSWNRREVATGSERHREAIDVCMLLASTNASMVCCLCLLVFLQAHRFVLSFVVF